MINILFKGVIFLINIPQVKLGIVAVSRDCFPVELSQKRRTAVVKACTDKKLNIVEVKTTVENEKDVLKALEELKNANVNALIVYLGNIRPEKKRCWPKSSEAQRCLWRRPKVSRIC